MNINLFKTRNYSGKLIVYEGIDGSGKSTVAKAVAVALRLPTAGFTAHYLFEPTNNHYGRMLRSAAASGKRFSVHEEAALFVKDRVANRDANLLPALMSGHIVNLDRYFHSSIAYQGVSGLAPETVFEMNKPVILDADLVLIFEVPVETALARIHTNRDSTTAFETKEFLEKTEAVYQSFEADNIRRIDSTQSLPYVLTQVLQLVRGIL